MDYSLPGSSLQEIFQGRILEWVVISSSGDLPVLGIEIMSSALQAASLPLSHQGSFQSVLACKNQPVLHLGKGPEEVLMYLNNSVDQSIWKTLVEG